MRELNSTELDRCTGGTFVGVSVDDTGKLPVVVVTPFCPPASEPVTTEPVDYVLTDALGGPSSPSAP